MKLPKKLDTVKKLRDEAFTDKKDPNVNHPLIKAIYDQVGDAVSFGEVIHTLASKDPLFWTIIYRRLKGKLTTFNIVNQLDKMVAAGEKPGIRELIRHRPFLIQPLRDQAKYKTYRKARQVGISENSITEEFWFLSNHPNTKWVHTFPREKQLTDFSNTRISEALDESPLMRALMGTPNQTFTKRIGDSFLFLRSAWESNLGEGIDVDGVTFDEKDRMKQGIEVAFKESLAASPYGLMRDISTPTVPNRGVDESFQKSDQKFWFNKCTKCGLSQTITEENIVQVKDIPRDSKILEPGTYEYLCRKSACRGKLDRWRGIWVPRFPKVKIVSGYSIPQTIAPWINATEVMQKKIDYRFPGLWRNYVLGEPAAGDTVLLNPHDFDDCRSEYPFPIQYRTKDFDRISVGIDWGGQNWIVVIGRNVHTDYNYLLNCFMTEDTETPLESTKEIIYKIQGYDPDIILGDAGYGKDRNEMLYRAYGDKVYMCQYNPASQKRATSLNPSWSEGTRRVLCDRTMTLKTTCREIKMNQLGMPATESRSFQFFMEHLLNLTPLVHEEDGKVWEEIQKKGDDHFAHALNYALLAQDYISGEETFQFGFLD